MKQPIIVACGVGRDSVGMLCRMHREGQRPDAILFANVGSEKRQTYEYIPRLRQWLREVPPDLEAQVHEEIVYAEEESTYFGEGYD